MGKLAATLAEIKPATTRPYCRVGVILDGLDDIDRQALINSLADVTLAGEDIAEALTSEGLTVRGHTVQRHRTRKCNCDAR